MAIIGISGYSGSGKDTVGRIIQYLHCDFQEDVGVEVAIHPDNDWLLEEQSGWEIKKWAGKLKEVASLLTGIPVHKFEDQEFKKTVLGPEWTTWKTNDGKPPKEGDAGIGKFMTVRDFLQRLGTEGLRTGLHENTWVNALMADYKSEYEVIYDSQSTSNPLPVKEPTNELGQNPNWIITDTRFPNEAQAIKDAGGIVIRVDRPGITPVNAHPSETGLDNYQFDEYITNDGDIKKLTETVREILIRREYYES
jgi:hypothetical protein